MKEGIPRGQRLQEVISTEVGPGTWSGSEVTGEQTMWQQTADCTSSLLKGVWVNCHEKWVTRRE